MTGAVELSDIYSGICQKEGEIVNEKVLFCIIGIVAMGFGIFSDVQLMKTNNEHKVRTIARIVFCSAAILLLAMILAGEM